MRKVSNSPSRRFAHNSTDLSKQKAPFKEDVFGLHHYQQSLEAVPPTHPGPPKKPPKPQSETQGNEVQNCRDPPLWAPASSGSPHRTFAARNEARARRGPVSLAQEKRRTEANCDGRQAAPRRTRTVGSPYPDRPPKSSTKALP